MTAEAKIEQIYGEAAYAAALMIWLIEHKMDHEADAEIVEILRTKPFFAGIVFSVMEVWR